MLVYYMVLFGILRAADGEDRISRVTMVALMSMMAALYSLAYAGSGWEWYAVLLMPALAMSYSFGWSLSVMGGSGALADWAQKFPLSGDILWNIPNKVRQKLSPRFMGALGFVPRVFFTFWLPLALVGNLAYLPLLCGLWALSYYVASLWSRGVGKRTRLAELLSGMSLGYCLLA